MRGGGRRGFGVVEQGITGCEDHGFRGHCLPDVEDLGGNCAVYRKKTWFGNAIFLEAGSTKYLTSFHVQGIGAKDST